MPDKHDKFFRRKTWKLREKIIRKAYISEGSIVAFPPCFPSQTAMLPADESRITAMDITKEGFIYAGTSGRKAHILIGLLHDVMGMVFDTGIILGADSTVAVCCGKKRYVAFCNGPRGGLIVAKRYGWIPRDLIQEWWIHKRDPEFLIETDELVHAVIDKSGEKAVGVSKQHLITVDLNTGKLKKIAEVSCKGRLVRTNDGKVRGFSSDGSAWSYNPSKNNFKTDKLKISSDFNGGDGVIWAKDPVKKGVYAADQEGSLYYLAGKNDLKKLGKTPLKLVSAMAVTFDGRLFGMNGEGISRIFCYDPSTKNFSDLGVPVSVIERRRYGYSFGDAVTGREGEIIFGENDDLGHLWMYFPRIKSLSR